MNQTGLLIILGVAAVGLGAYAVAKSQSAATAATQAAQARQATAPATTSKGSSIVQAATGLFSLFGL